MNDIEQLNAADLRAWYQRWYAPNNAVVVVVGDIVTDEVAALARKYFGPVPKSPVLPVKSRTEVAQKGIRRVTVRQPAKVPYLFLASKLRFCARPSEGRNTSAAKRCMPLRCSRVCSAAATARA